MSSSRANTPSKRVQMTSNDIYHSPGGTLQQLVSISDLSEKDLAKVYSSCFPKGSKFSLARCGCGYLHPFISIPSSSLQQILSNSLDHSFEKTTINDHPQKIIIRRTPQKEISVFFDAEAADKNKTLMQNIDEGIIYQRNPKINSNNLTANLVSLLGSDDFLGNQNTNNTVLTNQVVDRSKFSSGMENLIQEFENQIKSLREQLEHITAEKKLIEVTTNTITEKAAKQSEEIEKLLDEKNQQRERIHQLRKLLAKYEELSQKRDMEKNEVQNELKKLKSKFESESAMSNDKLKNSLQEREFEIEKLRSQLTISNSVANQLVDTKQELERRDNELQILQQDLHNAQLDLIGKEKSLSLISVKLENEQDLHTRSKRDLQTLSNTIQKKEKENDLISQKLETERSNYSLLVEKYQNLEAKLKQDQKHLARLEQDFSHNESAMESLKKKYDKVLELKEDLEKQIKSKSLELTCREETFEEELHKLKSEYETKLKNIQETNHLFTTQIEKLRSESKELHSKEDQFSRIQNEVETKLKEYKDKTDDLELQIQVLKVKNQQKENELLETKLILEKTEMESREYEQKMLEQQEALVKNVFNLESDNSKQVTEIDTLKSNCIKFEEIIKQLEEDLSTAKKNYSQVVEEVNSLQKKLNDMREYTDDLENDISNNKTTIENQLFELNKEKEALGELKSSSESIIQQLKHEIQTKISTIDSLSEILEQKNKSAESLATEINDLKKLIVEKENQLKAKEDLLQRKIKDLNGIIDSKSKEINLNQAELTELKSERHDLLVKYQEISRSLDQALETNKVQNDSIGELTEKIGILERDISKKQSSIDKQEKEIKLLRQEVVEKDTQYHSLRTTALSDLEHQLQRKNEEIENQKRNFDQDIYLLKSHLEESKTLFESKVELINELEDEISSLKNEAKEKEKEITSWLKDFENTKDNHEKEVEGLSCKIHTLQEELMIKDKTLTDLEKDKLILGTELSNMEASLKLKNQELDELGSSVDIIDSLQQENERLKLSQLEQAEDMERVSSELLAKENELIDLQNEKLNLDNELDDLSKRLQELEGTNEENRATISLYAEQHESLSNELREKTKNIEVLLARVEELKDSKSSLEEFIKGAKQDLENRIELVSTLEKSIAEKESEVRRAKEENLKEIATLEKKIVEKEEEIERISLQAEKQKKNMTSKIQDLEESLAEKENKEKKLMGSYSETNIKISELSTKLESIEMQKKRNENEIERLMNDLIMKDSEINQMNEKNKGLVMEIADLAEKLDSVEKVKRKIEATCLQLEEQKSNDDQKLKTMGSECLDLKQQLASFENEITLLKHKLSLLEKNNSDLKQDLMNSLENAELLEQELKLIRMNFKKDKELLGNQLINEVNERDDMIKELRAQLVADSSLRLELDQVKELSQKSLTLLDEQNEEVKKLQIEVIQYTNIIDQFKQENDTKLSEMSVNNQSQIEELENRNRELAEMKLNYQKLESMFFQMERDYRTLQSQDSVINRQLEEKCIQLQTKLEETIEPITNKEEELKRLTKENTEMKDQIVENKQITEKMEQEIERLLEQLTTSSSAGGSYLGSDSSLLSSNSNTANVKSNRTTQSPLKTSHLMQSATIDLKYLWKQLRSEIVRLKQKNVELAQQIMHVTRAREDSIVKYEKQLKSTMVDLMHYKKVAEEVEQLRLDNTRLTLTKKDSEELMNNLSIKLSTLEAEKQNLWRLQDQTRKELINLKENVIKLSEENERLSRIESKASNIANLELEKLKKEKRLLEEKLLLANDTSKTQKETSQLMNKIKEARITREKLEKLIRDQRHQIDEMDSANRELKMKLQNFEKSTAVQN